MFPVSYELGFYNQEDDILQNRALFNCNNCDVAFKWCSISCFEKLIDKRKCYQFTKSLEPREILKQIIHTDSS
jgi:hypothetical protein